MFRIPHLVGVARLLLLRLRFRDLLQDVMAVGDGNERPEDLDDAEILRRLIAYEPIFRDVAQLRDAMADHGSSLSISARRAR